MPVYFLHTDGKYRENIIKKQVFMHKNYMLWCFFFSDAGCPQLLQLRFFILCRACCLPCCRYAAVVCRICTAFCKYCSLCLQVSWGFHPGRHLVRFRHHSLPCCFSTTASFPLSHFRLPRFFLGLMPCRLIPSWAGFLAWCHADLFPRAVSLEFMPYGFIPLEPFSKSQA